MRIITSLPSHHRIKVGDAFHTEYAKNCVITSIKELEEWKDKNQITYELHVVEENKE